MPARQRLGPNPPSPPPAPAGDIAFTNSRKLLRDVTPLQDAIVSSCVKTYRFQWWGWALELAYLALVLVCLAKACRGAGVVAVGTTITTLAMIFANE